MIHEFIQVLAVGCTCVCRPMLSRGAEWRFNLLRMKPGNSHTIHLTVLQLQLECGIPITQNQSWDQYLRNGHEIETMPYHKQYCLWAVIGLSGNGTQTFFLCRFLSRSSARRILVTSSFSTTEIPVNSVVSFHVLLRWMELVPKL